MEGDYVAPASTFLVQSTVAERDELFPALLLHLRRQYPEVYGLGVDTAWAHERRELIIGEGEGLSGGTSVSSSIKLGAYTGRLANLNLVGNIKTSPNVTAVYLDTPLVGPTPDPLEYAPLIVRLGQPRGYPLNSAGGRLYTGGSKIRPPHPYPHPPAPTPGLLPQLVGRNCAGCCRQQAKFKMQLF